MHLANEDRLLSALSPAERQVEPGSAAHAAGIERGELLITLDEAEVISSTGLARQLENLSGRQTVPAGLLRGNEPVTVRLTLP